MYIWAAIGDLDYWTKTLELPNSNSNHPCALCPANITTHPWWDFRPNAAWLHAIYKQVETTCGLFLCPGVSVLSLYPDWMHVKHLGIDKVLLGSVLWILVNMILPGDDASAKLTVIWSDIMRIYKEDNVSCRYGAIKMTMFTHKTTPKLKGKAAEIKHLGPVFVKVFRAYMSEHLLLRRQNFLLLKMGCHLDSIIDNGAGVFQLDGAESNDLISTGFGYLALFYKVSIAFKADDMALFSLTAKAHYLMHICLLSRYSNFTCPSWGWGGK